MSVLVMGAGAIGCYVGGRLMASGVDVTLVGRPSRLDTLRQHGLTLTDLNGLRLHVPPHALRLSDSVPINAHPTLVLLCVKTGATAMAAAQLQAALPAGTPVLSLQNGLHNGHTAQSAAPSLAVHRGMVPWNVAELNPGHFHRGTDGTLAAQDAPVLHPWVAIFAQAGIPMALHTDMTAVQWAKLLLNLNNPVNALSGLPLKAQLLDRGYRRVLAALVSEALTVLAHAHQPLARLTPLPPAWLPALLRLPTPVFRLAAARLLRMDEQARSSMADDMAQGRPTEIDALCGEVVRLAAAQGQLAPLNSAMTQLVHAEQTKARRPWPANALMAALAQP